MPVIVSRELRKAKWVHVATSSGVHLLNPGGNEISPRFRLLDTEPSAAELPVILRIHSWCAASQQWLGTIFPPSECFHFNV
jgi:hypothetical protein